MTGAATAAEVLHFRNLLADLLGWTFAETDGLHLGQVMSRRAERLGISHARYLRRLGVGDEPAELTALAEELTITETHFFRHSEQFRALAEEVLPDRIRDRARQRMLRMLSVGCSSGEEAYTMAIVAREVQPAPDWTVSVLGLDANPAMLRRAGAGRYSSWSLRETPDAVRQRWFRPLRGAFELRRAVRDSVQFRYCNVTDEDPVRWQRGQYDVIFCRNLLMYLTPATVQSLIRRLTRALTPGGYLFLGHTDTLGSRPDGLQLRHSHATFYYRRPSDGEPVRPRQAPQAEVRQAPQAEVRPPGLYRPRAPKPTGTAAAGTPPAGNVAGPPPFRDRALALLRAERFNEALRVIEDGRPGVIEDGLPARSEPRDLLLHGVLLAQAGRLDDAEMTARRLLDIDGLYADAHHLLGVCLEGGAAVDVAIGHYRLAAYLDPEFAMPRLRLGLLARRRDDRCTAGTELERARQLLRAECEERVLLFGGGFGRIALLALCRAELDATGVCR